MKFLSIEYQYKKSGHNLIAGIDEVGRGALAGPLVAAAVILAPNMRLSGLNDSKKISDKLRRELSYKIMDGALAYAFGLVEAEEIDKVGIARANFLAFKRALLGLNIKPDLVLADYFNYTNLPYKTIGIVKGDSKVRSIAAASVVAKVYRDDLMKQYHAEYPNYGFDKHVGYGTALHIQNIKSYGLSKLHRRSFVVKQL